MGKRGPKPKPLALKIHDGSRVSPSARNDLKAESDVKCPSAPTWLGKSGKTEWKKTAPQLHAVGLLAKIDVTLFAIYCGAFDDFHAACENIAKNGVIVEGYRGSAVKNPALTIKNAASLLIVKIGSLFGLSPSSRVGLNAPTVDIGFDELESFKRGDEA